MDRRQLPPPKQGEAYRRGRVERHVFRVGPDFVIYTIAGEDLSRRVSLAVWQRWVATATKSSGVHHA
jgi:hypothetical protein